MRVYESIVWLSIVEIPVNRHQNYLQIMLRKPIK